MKTEGIEALVYPSPEFFRPEGGAALPPERIKTRLDAIISEVNQRLLPYQRIDRLVVLDAPMEMTTTKKIKRDSL
jgi:long-chain acyl-CoA synthetase